MSQTNTIQLPYSFTVPLDRTKEVEIVFRLKERKKALDWGTELLTIFEPAQKKSQNYSLKKIENDIERAVRAVRQHA